MDGGSSPNVLSFGRRKVLALFFRPIGATIETILDLSFFPDQPKSAEFLKLLIFNEETLVLATSGSS